MSHFDYRGHKIFCAQTGEGPTLLLLHGNTASSRMFAPIVPALAEKHRVITLDFLGCGQSERQDNWPGDLWFQWAEQAAALCEHLKLQNVAVLGCSGGALAALNLALEHPELVEAVVADSFEGIRADAAATEQIRIGREYAKQNAGFCAMLRQMHGADWEDVLNADTQAVVNHARQIGVFFHKPLSELRAGLLLTGSAEDEMFPQGHYEQLFAAIRAQIPSASVHIFPHGGHPAMMSNLPAYIPLCESFLSERRGEI